MLIVAGDAHIGAGASLGRLPDQESSWTRLCTTACEMQSDVLGVGDWLHHRKPSPSEVDAFQSGLRILRDGGRRFVSVVGNHEVVSEDAPSCLETACAGFSADVWRSPYLMSTEDGVVGFLPWAPPRLSAAEASEALMVVAADLAERGARILIAHHAIAGGSLPTGLPLLDLAEPMLDPHALAAMGYEFVLSGHIHKRQVILHTSECLVAHIGPLCRSNFGEASVETGAWQVGTFGNGVFGVYPFDVPDRAFVTIDADVRGSIDATEQLLAAIDQHKIEGAIVRVQFSQTSDQVVDTVAVVAQLTGQGAHRIDTLTPVIERAQSTRSAGVTELTDPRESFGAWLEGQRELAAEETLAAARERAYERIGGAA